jgi:hypothetical protein
MQKRLWKRNYYFDDEQVLPSSGKKIPFDNLLQMSQTSVA